MHEEQSARAEQASNCRYCGCPLSAAYYFCPNCATRLVAYEDSPPARIHADRIVWQRR